MSVRMWIMVALAVGVAFVAGIIWTAGRDHERQQEMIRDASDAVEAGKANAEGARATIRIGDEFARRAARRNEGVADARREIEQAGEPAPGTVGRDAMVDPALGLSVLCRVEWLRGYSEADSPNCRAAAARDPGQPS